MYAIIVDEESTCCEALTNLIKEHCPDIYVLNCCPSAYNALNTIQQYQPSLLFLTIEMTGMNGFELLNQLPVIAFNIIFMSKEERYRTTANQYNPLDYLLKPISSQALETAAQKARAHYQKPLIEQLQKLYQKINHLSNHCQMALPTLEGLQMINIDNIIYCESESNYTRLFLKNKQKIVISKTLKDIEELLHHYSFIRVHHSYLVNINEIDKYIKGDGGYLIMNDGSEIFVSRNKREILVKKLIQNK
jgi:two-component system LytT family response regulator